MHFHLGKTGNVIDGRRGKKLQRRKRIEKNLDSLWKVRHSYSLFQPPGSDLDLEAPLTGRLELFLKLQNVHNLTWIRCNQTSLLHLNDGFLVWWFVPTTKISWVRISIYITAQSHHFSSLKYWLPWCKDNHYVPVSQN